MPSTVFTPATTVSPATGIRRLTTCSEMPDLAIYFPESRFVHMIRDGRDVALALLDVPFGPDTPEGCAEYWMTRVTAGRSAGQRLGEGRYLEVRYEELLARPFQGAPANRYISSISRDSPAMLDFREAVQRQLRMSPRPRRTKACSGPSPEAARLEDADVGWGARSL